MKISFNAIVGVAGIVGAGVSILALAHSFYASRPKPELVGKNDRFYCSLQADPMKGGETWTVMYRYGEKAKPWLRMVRAMGGDWHTQRRCETIAGRLDLYRQDGLLRLEYRTDPKTPGQYVICAKTKVSEGGCPLVLTLLPEDNPYDELREVAGALTPGSLPSYQCSDLTACPPADPVSISLSKQLVPQDR